VEEEFRQIVEVDGGPHTVPQAEFDRVAAMFTTPTACRGRRRRR
jgi:sulfite reductase (NADPH) hemoprotein beta-component